MIHACRFLVDSHNTVATAAQIHRLLKYDSWKRWGEHARPRLTPRECAMTKLPRKMMSTVHLTAIQSSLLSANQKPAKKLLTALS